MKLLFDQNISYRIVDKVDHLYDDCKQVSQVGLKNTNDLEIWQFARKENYTIVTFDSDFYDISLLKGYPPKIIWLRVGNATTQEIANILISSFTLIETFISDLQETNNACLEIQGRQE